MLKPAGSPIASSGAEPSEAIPYSWNSKPIMVERRRVKTKNLWDITTLYKVTHDLHKKGLKIGLTHGAFDLFHLSHLYLLKESAKLCDFLIVGVDCDKNVSKYKTYRRPINSDEERLKLIGEIRCVDAVFLNTTPLFNEEYIKLYRNLKANTVTFGYNFGFEREIRKRQTETKTQIIQIDTPQFPTTTSIINRVIERYSS